MNSHEDSLSDEFADTITRTFPRGATKAVAQDFLEGLYLAFPVSVKEVLDSSDNKSLLIEERKGLSDVYSIPGQVNFT